MSAESQSTGRNSPFHDGERVLSETSLRFLPLASMQFSRCKPRSLDHEETAFFLSLMRRQFDEAAFCSVCKIIRNRTAIYSREEMAAEFLSSNLVRKGSASFFPRTQVLEALSAKGTGEVVRLVLPSYSIKTLRYLKTRTNLPDSAEMFGLLNLMRIAKALEHILNRRCRFVILSDGLRFHRALSHSTQEVRGYQDELLMMINGLGLSQWIELNDYETLLLTELDNQTVQDRISRYYDTAERYRQLMIPIFHPSRAEESLAKMIRIDPDFDEYNPSGEGRFVALFRSLLFSVNYRVSVPTDYDSPECERLIFSDIFDTTNPQFGKVREQILLQTLSSAIEYIARVRMDRTGPDPIRLVFPSSIRCTIHPKPEQLAITTVTQRTRIEPWHGSGYVKFNGNRLDVGADFRIALETSGFRALNFTLPWNGQNSCLYVNDEAALVSNAAEDQCECVKLPF